MSIVPKGGRAAWHAKAMDAAQGADLDSLIELGLLQLLRRRLASVVTDPLQSLRTLPPGSGGRRACASWTPRKASITTLRCQISRTPSDVRSGGELAAEWEATVQQVRACHYRKTGFLSGFEAVAAGSRPDGQPSFLDRAKTRWSGRYRSST